MTLTRTNVYSLCHYRNIKGDDRTHVQKVQVIRLWSDQVQGLVTSTRSQTK